MTAQYYDDASVPKGYDADFGGVTHMGWYRGPGYYDTTDFSYQGEFGNETGQRTQYVGAYDPYAQYTRPQDTGTWQYDPTAGTWRETLDQYDEFMNNNNPGITLNQAYGPIGRDQFMSAFYSPYQNIAGIRSPDEFLYAGWTPEAYARALVYAGSEDPNQAGRQTNAMSRTTDIIDAYMNQQALLDARGGQRFDWHSVPALQDAYNRAYDAAKAQAQISHETNTDSGDFLGLDWQDWMRGLSIMAPGAMAAFAPATAAISAAGGGLGSGLSTAGGILSGEIAAGAAIPWQSLAGQALGIVDPRLAQVFSLANTGAGMLGGWDAVGNMLGGLEGAAGGVTADNLSSWLEGAEASDQLGTAVAGEVQRWVDAGMPAIESFNWSSPEAAAVAVGTTGGANGEWDVLPEAPQGPTLPDGTPAPGSANGEWDVLPEAVKETAVGALKPGQILSLASKLYGLLAGGGGQAAGGMMAAQQQKNRAEEIVNAEYADEAERQAAYMAYAQQLMGFAPTVSEAFAMDPANVGTQFGNAIVDPVTGEVRYELTPGTREYFDALMQNANDTLSRALGTDVDKMTAAQLEKAMEPLAAKRDQDFAKLTAALYARGMLGLISYSGSGEDLTSGKTYSWQAPQGQGVNPYFAAYEARIAEENQALADKSRSESENYIQQLLNHSGGLFGKATDIDESMLGALFNAGEYIDEEGERKQKGGRGLYDLLAGPQGAFLEQLMGGLPSGKAAGALADVQSAEDARRMALMRGLFGENL